MIRRPNPGRYFLIGFMGVGKTTVGRDLASRLGIPFYDLDDLIEKHTGRRIQEIFADKGEAAFRLVETATLRRVAELGSSVIATGGGTFTLPENREIIRAAGISIWLDASTEFVLDRGSTGKHRPLWKGMEEAKVLLEQRLPQYARADLRLDLGSSSPGEAAERLAKLLESHNLT